jgi:hypothetical protein
MSPVASMWCGPASIGIGASLIVLWLSGLRQGILFYWGTRGQVVGSGNVMNVRAGYKSVRCLAGILALVLFLAEPVWGKEVAVQTSYKGIALIGLAPDPGVDYDVAIIAPERALDVIEDGLDLLLATSPESARDLDMLKKSGRVAFIYHPGFPKEIAGGLGTRLAAFAPNYFAGSATNFPVIFGRYIVKWDRKHIALTIAHELMGHGIQHLQGRLKTNGDLDTECEASLVEEGVRQQLGIDKTSALSVRFRQGLEWKYCVPFKQYIAANEPAEMALWNSLNPDVPALLAVFSRYAARTR